MGGLSPEFSADTSEVTRTGLDLQEVSRDVEHGKTFDPVGGAAPYAQLTGAVGRYKDAWSNALQRLTDDISGLGVTTHAVGGLLAEHDQQMAQVWGAAEK